ncbi:hypothetical protein [Oceanobacillus massiliensis]|uniref:hypothetical protein n=1 Tax=Oceanobacillus massiliensis TaxID=1465765 RepID=UPI0012B6508F|nr:hypothetical protein [Oceanobacillus massiliensis]
MSEDPTAVLFREEAEAAPAESDFPELKSTTSPFGDYGIYIKNATALKNSRSEFTF